MRTDFSTSLMEERVKKDIEASRAKPKDRISRRRLLGYLVALGATGGAVVAAPSIVRYVSSGFSEEDVTAFKTQENVYVREKAGLKSEVIPITYFNFRGAIFGVYPVTADAEDTGPLSLIYRTNKLFSPNQNIKGDMDSRAVELFNILYHNRNRLTGLNLNKTETFRLKTDVAAPVIHPGTRYQVPIPVGYSSLDDAIASITYNRHRQQ